MDDIQIYIKDKLTTEPVLSSLWEQYELIRDGVIITISPFLQRYLQKEAWMKMKCKKAKEYLHSAFSATSLFEPFILVSIDLLIENLSSDIKQWEKDGKEEMVDQAKKVLKELRQHKDRGAKWAKIDGQSRNKLALKPFFESEVAMDKSMIFKSKSDLDWEYDTKNKLFKDMPEDVKSVLKKIKAFCVQITGGNIDNVVDALIAKQENVPFTTWQKTFHGKVISVFANRIQKSTTEPIIAGYKKAIIQNDKYKAEDAGLEYFFATLSTFIKYKDWPSDAKLKNIISGIEDVPTTRQVGIVKKYVQMFLDYFGTIPKNEVNKYKSKVLQNFVIFNWYLDNSQNKESFFSQYNLPKIEIQSENLWVKQFIEMHKILTDTNNSEQYELIDGKNTARQLSYPAGNANDKTNLIEWRVSELSKLFKELLPEIKRKNIIKTENINMPSMTTVEVSSGFKTMTGEDVDPRKKYHRGHEISKYNKGGNEVENLKPQEPVENLQYNKRNVVK